MSAILRVVRVSGAKLVRFVGFQKVRHFNAWRT